MIPEDGAEISDCEQWNRPENILPVCCSIRKPNMEKDRRKISGSIFAAWNVRIFHQKGPISLCFTEMQRQAWFEQRKLFQMEKRWNKLSETEEKGLLYIMKDKEPEEGFPKRWFSHSLAEDYDAVCGRI